LGYLSLLSSLTIVGGIFEGGQLTGTIPSELGLLTNLNSIYIQAHKITGTVPNELFENKPDLEMIAITRQRLTGPLPTNFAASTKLNDLQFQGNEFTGTIPSEYGRFTTLDNLELKNNNLNGTIPESFYNLDFLTQLSLDGNNLSGTISSRVSGLTDLRFLNLGDNQLKGTIPTTLYEMLNLTVVRVQNNQLTGTISEDIALLNSTFRILEGYNNKFSGEIPIAAFESIPRLREVILHGNNFMTGKVSVALCEKSSLKNLTVPSGVDCVDAGCCN
jgi:Leucine-rich repeat (LRR) protein